MKKLALTICVILGLAGVALAQQNQEDNTVLTMPISAPCSPYDNALATLEREHGEYPFAQGIGLVWNSKIQEYLEVVTLVFVNPKTFTYTIAYEVPEDNLICILTLGDQFQPVRRGNNL